MKYRRNKSTAITDLKIMLPCTTTSEAITWKVSTSVLVFSSLWVTVWQRIHQMVHHKNDHTGQMKWLHLSPPSTVACLQERSKVDAREQNRKGARTPILPRILYQSPDCTDPRTRPGTRVLVLQISCAMAGLSVNSKTMISRKSKEDTSGSLQHDDQPLQKSQDSWAN